MLFPVYQEMQDQSDKAVRKAVGASTWVCGTGYERERARAHTHTHQINLL
jgi:hypothetical protein